MLDGTHAGTVDMQPKPRDNNANGSPATRQDANNTPTNASGKTSALELDDTTKQMRSNELPSTSTHDTEMDQGDVETSALGNQDGAPIAGDELHDSTAGNLLLQPTVARDAGGSKPAVLAGSIAPPADGDRSRLLETSTTTQNLEEDGRSTHQQPISPNVTPGDSQFSQQMGATEQPARF